MLAPVFFSLTGCALVTVPVQALHWSRTQDRDTIPAYRRYLSRYPGGAQATEARRRIATKLWEDTQRRPSIAAYKAFLVRYERTPFTKEAARQLRALRYRRAIALGSIAAFEDFLVHHPEGPAADRVRDRLARRRLNAATASARQGDGAPLRLFVLGYADHPLAGAARQRLEQLELAKCGDDVSALRAFLKRWPEGRRREVAFSRLRGATRERALALARAEVDPQPLDAWTYEFGPDPQVFERRAELALDDALATLRVSELERLIESWPGTSAAERAAAQIARWEKLGPRQRRSLESARQRAGELFFEPAPAVTRELSQHFRGASSPPRQWWAAAELAQSADPGAAEPLLRCLGRAYLETRRRCGDALAQLAETLTPEARRRMLSAQLAVTRPRAASPAMRLRVGLLLELLGELEEAAAAYRLAAQEGELGAYALLRLAQLELRRGEDDAAQEAASAVLSRIVDMGRARQLAAKEGLGAAGAEQVVRGRLLKASQAVGMRKLAGDARTLLGTQKAPPELGAVLAQMPGVPEMITEPGPVTRLAMLRREALSALSNQAGPLADAAIARASRVDPDAQLRAQAMQALRSRAAARP